jgi:hypothetical protein
MIFRTPCRFAVTVTALILLAACDPGYYRAPVDWPQPSPGVWVRHFEGFTLRVPRLSGLAGESYLLPTFEIRDNDLPVALLSATLSTPNGTYAGTINHLYATVPKGGGYVMPSWRFSREHRIPEMIGDRAYIVLEFLVGSRSVIVRVEYDRSGARWGWQ